MQAIFRERAKRANNVKNEQKQAKYLKIWEKCAKFENILKRAGDCM